MTGSASSIILMRAAGQTVGVRQAQIEQDKMRSRIGDD
jgi:hypothetical protein